jgi:hypothetical protein
MLNFLFCALIIVIIVKIKFHFEFYKARPPREDLEYIEFLVFGWFKDPLNWIMIHAPIFWVNEKGWYKRITLVSVLCFWVICMVIIFLSL